MMQAFSLMPLLFYIVSLFILYLVIQAAVRNGINSSIIGKVLQQENREGDRLAGKQNADSEDRDDLHD